MNNKKISVVVLKGKEIHPFIPELAKLRIELFREYPYRYDGTLEYEYNYLETYLQCPHSCVVVALDEHQVVGAATGIPLEHEIDAFKAPYLKDDIKHLFYVGELLLRPDYRGQTPFIPMMKAIRKEALAYQANKVVFCAVDRPIKDPKAPEHYVSLEKLWHYFNFKKMTEKTTYLSWKEIDEDEESPKKMIFWERGI